MTGSAMLLEGADPVVISQVVEQRRDAVTSLHADMALASRRVSSSQTRVRGAPNSAHAATGANEQRGRGEAHESQKQRIFDQVLALFVAKKIV